MTRKWEGHPAVDGKPPYAEANILAEFPLDWPFINEYDIHVNATLRRYPKSTILAVYYSDPEDCEMDDFEFEDFDNEMWVPDSGHFKAFKFANGDTPEQRDMGYAAARNEAIRWFADFCGSIIAELGYSDPVDITDFVRR
jgi:hypothetical protein